MTVLLLSLSLLGCTPQPSFAPVSRGTVVLGAGWSAQPWEDPPLNTASLSTATQLRLPAGMAGAGSELRLDGAWWTVEATVNGTAASATGGIAPTWVDLGGALVDGENTLSLQVSPPAPNTSTLETGGSLSSAARSPRGAQLLAAPILLLQPAQHVSYATLGATGSGLHPRAVTEDAPEGATVHFKAVLDGKVLADLGTAPVVAGTAQATEAPFPTDAWGIGAGSLFWLVAELRGADGAVLDRWAGRTGARQAQPSDSGGLQIGDQAGPLMGARMVNEGDMDFFRERLQGYAAAGVNALEVHGEQLRPDYLGAADELGLPVVVVPRCIGRSGRNRNVNRSTLAATYAAQDARMARALAEHPSVVLLAVEGPTGGARLHSDALLSGPLDGSRLPVAGSEPRVSFDVPARVVNISGGVTLATLQTTCMPKRCERAWMVEMTAHWNRNRSGRPSDQWALCAAAFSSHLDGGSPGGIIPTPNQRDEAGWSAAWGSLAASRGLPQVPGSGRGDATVTVTGLTPGEVVWLEAPLLNPTGAIADSSGAASLSLYHAGPATVRAGARSAAVTLTPGRWEDFAWLPQTATVALTP